MTHRPALPLPTACRVAGAALALALAGGWSLAGPLAPVGAQSTPSGSSPAFSVTSSGTPSITVTPDTGLPAATGAPDATGTTNVTTPVTITDSGFSSSDTGGFGALECNDDPDQPTFLYFGIETLPVGCDISLQLASPAPTSFSVVSGNVGVANGSTCSASSGNCDSVGNPPAQDAASYPCPPTAAQQASGYVCALIVAGISSALTAQDLAAQPLEWSGEAQPTMTASGTAQGSAYPGEIISVAGTGWPVTPTAGLAGSATSITGAMSVCDPESCVATTATSTPPSVGAGGQLSGTMAIPVSASGGVTYPCTSDCYIQLAGTETISQSGLSATISAVDSAPLTISASDEPAPSVSGVDPSWSLLAGGSTLTVSGTAFTGTTSVDLCTVASAPVCTPGTDVSVVDDDELTVTAPAGTAGKDDVVVTNAVGRSATSGADQISYSATAPSPGYWMLSANGTVYPFGSAADLGSATSIGATVGLAATPDGGGYWVASATGAVAAFGDAPDLTPASPPSGTVVTIAATPDGKGYWLATSTGQVATAGDAVNYGNAPSSLNAPIVDMAPTPDGKGYWLLGADGGVFTEGDAGFYGSTGAIHLNQPAVAMAPTSDGKGYWFVAADGGIFAYGDATYYGSTYQLNPALPPGGTNSIAPVNKPVNGIVVTAGGGGYWMVASDGGVFTFGDAGFVGSLGGQSIPAPIVAFAPD